MLSLVGTEETTMSDDALVLRQDRGGAATLTLMPAK
jgi:hypothetical protein